MSVTYRFCPYCGKDTQCEVHVDGIRYEYECITCGNMVATKSVDFSREKDNEEYK